MVQSLAGRHAAIRCRSPAMPRAERSWTARARPRPLVTASTEPPTTSIRWRYVERTPSASGGHRRLDPGTARGKRSAPDGNLDRHRQPDQGDRRRHRALDEYGCRRHERQHPDIAQNAQNALVAASNEVSTRVKSTSSGYRTFGARRQQRVRLDHDRQDRRDRHLCSAADRPAGADDRRPPRSAGRGAGTEDHQLTTDVDRVTAGRAEHDRGPRPGLCASMSATVPKSRATSPRQAISPPARWPIAEGSRTGVALGDRAVAPGFDRGRHRNAGDQQDPAHRYGRAVRAPARRQHPAAGSADRRPRQPQLAGARTGDARRRLRVGDERRHVAQRHRDPDAGRPADRLQFQDDQGAGRSRRAVRPVRSPRQGAGRGGRRGRTGNRNATTSVADRKTQARIRWSPPSTCAPPISTSDCRASPACSTNRSPRPKSGRATSRAWSRKPQAPDRPRSAGNSRRSGLRGRRASGSRPLEP